MFFITFSMLWSFSYFFLIIYTITIFSILLYALPTIKDVINYNKFKKNIQFDYLTGFDLYWILVTPLFLIFLTNYSWVGPSISAWFGHIIFSNFQFKINFLIIFFFFFNYYGIFYSLLFFFKRNLWLHCCLL